jgi:hypothetical protein
VQQAFENMYQCPPRSARAWGDLVRSASPHKGPWPRISVWHGGADATVIPQNSIEIVKQWTDVHGLPARPSFEAVADGYPRQVWVNDAGDELIESYSIPHMAHGTPLATGKGDEKCGTAGPFLLEVGISSSYHIAKFFRLTGDRAHIASNSSRVETLAPKQLHVGGAKALPEPEVLEGEVLSKDFRMPQADEMPPTPPLDIGAVITEALRAAGLMRGP